MTSAASSRPTSASPAPAAGLRLAGHPGRCRRPRPRHLQVTLDDCAEGTVTLTFGADEATDTAGNLGPALATDGPEVTIDRTDPTVTIDLQAASDSGASDSDDLTNAASLVFDVTFSERVSGVTAADFSVTGSAGASCDSPVTLGDAADSDAATYTVTLDHCAAGTVSVTFGADKATDTAGNDGPALATSGPTVTIDRSHPTVTIDQKLGQADPTNTSPIGFTVTFSESVSGFDETDVSIGGTAGGTKTVVVTGGPAVYGIAVSGMTTNGTVIASIDADKASDTAGNGNVASTSTDGSVTWTQQATSDIHVRFQAPLDESMTTTSKIINKAKNGRVLPVQIELYRGTKKLTSADVAEGQVQLLVTRMTTCDAVTGDDIETYAAAGTSNTGNQFRWAGTKMVFNLDTANKSRASAVGSCYRLDVLYNGNVLISWAPTPNTLGLPVSPAAQRWVELQIVK